MLPSVQLIGFVALVTTHLFPSGSVTDFDNRSPGSFPIQVHSSVPSYSFRVPSFSFPLELFRERAYLPGISVLFAVQPERVHSLRGVPSSRYVPSLGFLNLSTVYSASWRHGFISPRNRVQDSSPFRGFHPSHSRAFSSKAPAPLPLLPNLLSVRKQSPFVRPLDFEALLRAKIRFVGSRFRRTADRSPHRVHPLAGYRSDLVLRLTQSNPLMELVQLGLRAGREELPTACSQSQLRSRRLRRDQPVRGFEPSFQCTAANRCR